VTHLKYYDGPIVI